MKIYLCGGMHNKWQDYVIDALPQHQFLDPRSHGLQNEKEYTAWDLEAIRSCDVVLAYMDNDNPSGFGLNLEIGYAKALGRSVFLAMEPLGFRHKYFGMARACAFVHRESLDEIISVIRAL